MKFTGIIGYMVGNNPCDFEEFVHVSTIWILWIYNIAIAAALQRMITNKLYIKQWQTSPRREGRTIAAMDK